MGGASTGALEVDELVVEVIVLELDEVLVVAVLLVVVAELDEVVVDEELVVELDDDEVEDGEVVDDEELEEVELLVVAEDELDELLVVWAPMVLVSDGVLLWTPLASEAVPSSVADCPVPPVTRTWKSTDVVPPLAASVAESSQALAADGAQPVPLQPVTLRLEARTASRTGEAAAAEPALTRSK